MAQVDFSHAVLDVNTAGCIFAQSDRDLELNISPALYEAGLGNQINQNATISVLSQTLTKKEILYTGEFKASGTEFYTIFGMWKVSNISFSAGDTYSFVVTTETTIQ